MIAPLDVFVGPNHLREVYPFPVMLDVEPFEPCPSWIVTKELMIDCAHDAQMVRNRVALERELGEEEKRRWWRR